MIPIVNFPQALFCASISFICLFICLYATYITARKNSNKYIFISFIMFNVFIFLNCFSEFVAFISSAFTSEYYSIIVNLYLISIYGFAIFFLWFCTCLNGKPNWLVLTFCCLVFSLFAMLQYKGLLIDGYKWNGFTLIRTPGKFFTIFEIISACIISCAFFVLIRNSMSEDSDIRSRSIITLFAATPLTTIMTLILVLMKFSDNYAPVLFVPIFFAWMDLFLLLATGRAVLDLSFSKQHIKAYRLLLESASTKDMDMVTRMKMIEEVWYMLSGPSNFGDIDNASQVDSSPEALYKKVENELAP